ncbi:hypothetical protein BJ322DRAFT_829530 [Thelephora terrestris]|uniref:BTB domain-containing protein n=1 Tax=Thelephora terrestris TaxID=56493 RepID=A0A9P6HHF1_9AGAM|nr:hypothetical protein BJ322DRAFT_829530 [Thelephora terrestris]
MAATTALREALNRGMCSGNLVDTKIILYSRRENSGRVSRPKALYASSHVLKTVPYFNDLFSGDFAESQSKDFKSPIDEEEYREDYEYFSDSDLEDDEDEKTSFKHASKPEVHSFDPFATADEDKPGCENYEERLEKGKVVKVSDIAFVTFQAFLMYLYTNVIEFAPFGSQENRRSRSAEIINSSDEEVPRPSPKSIYRLADKYDVPALKTLALNHIQGQLAKCDIVEEAFSRFASRHDEIRNLYIQQLAYKWMEDSTTKATHSSVKEKINSFVKGDLERATEVLYELLEIASKDEELLAPTNTSPVIVRAVSHDNWTPVRTALIKSIREGVFFDRKYWARHYKAGDVLEPIYFSSACMGGNVQLLNKCTSKSIG